MKTEYFDKETRTMPKPSPKKLSLHEAKELRAKLGEIVEILRDRIYSDETKVAIRRIQEGKMWLGLYLGSIGSEDLNSKRDKEELANCESTSIADI